jgi:TIR domain
MADVFISHSERDREVADQLAAFLLGIRRSVWWAPDPADDLDMTSIRASELFAARVVVVLWSKAAFISPFMLHEAIAARDARGAARQDS